MVPQLWKVHPLNELEDKLLTAAIFYRWIESLVCNPLVSCLEPLCTTALQSRPLLVRVCLLWCITNTSHSNHSLILVSIINHRFSLIDSEPANLTISIRWQVQPGSRRRRFRLGISFVISTGTLEDLIPAGEWLLRLVIRCVELQIVVNQVHAWRTWLAALSLLIVCIELLAIMTIVVSLRIDIVVVIFDLNAQVRHRFCV